MNKSELKSDPNDPKAVIEEMADNWHFDLEKMAQDYPGVVSFMRLVYLEGRISGRTEEIARQAEMHALLRHRGIHTPRTNRHNKTRVKIASEGRK